MKNREKNGFTLVEILAVVVILGILLVIAIPSYTAVFNSLKRTTYINKIKALNLAAKDYASNTEVKDSIKSVNFGSKPDWCNTIKVSDLIKAGYVSSESDILDVIYDNYTGTSLGYYKFGDVNDSYVSLCYCYNEFEVESYLVNDLGSGNSYKEGEIIRNMGNKNTYVFSQVLIDFVYDDIADRVINALNNGNNSISVGGVRVEFGTTFDGVESLSLDDETFVNALNKVIASKLARATSCNHPENN